MPHTAEAGLLLFVPPAEEPSPPAESRRQILRHEPGSSVVDGATVRARITGARAGRGRLTAIRARVRLAARRFPRVTRALLTARRFPGVTRTRLTARRPPGIARAKPRARRFPGVTRARPTGRRPGRATSARLTAGCSCGIAPGAA